MLANVRLLQLFETAGKTGPGLQFTGIKYAARVRLHGTLGLWFPKIVMEDHPMQRLRTQTRTQSKMKRAKQV